MLAHWNGSPARNSPSPEVTDILKQISPLRANLGYAGAVITVCATIMLSLSIAGSLIVNRHWRPPKRTSSPTHLRGCGRITAFLLYHLHSNTGPDKTKEKIPVNSCCSILSLDLLGLVTLICTPVLCIIFCTLPAIILLAISLLVVVAEFGAEAAYPCWVGFVCLMSLHCTGRLWGLWISDGYTAWMCRKIRRSSAVRGPIDSSEPEYFTEPTDSAALLASEKEDLDDDDVPDNDDDDSDSDNDDNDNFPPARCAMVVSGTLTVLYYALELSVNFPRVASLFGVNQSLPMAPCMECCINDEAILNPGSAMFSYWGWGELDRFNNSQTESLVKFSPSGFAQFIGGVLSIYSILAIFYILLACIGLVLYVIGLGLGRVMTWFMHDTDGNDGRAAESLGTQLRKTARKVANEYLRLHTSASISICVCDRMVNIVGRIIIVLRRTACWLLLPIPVLRLFLTERMQLPGLIAVLTGYLVWVYGSSIYGRGAICGEKYRIIAQKPYPRRPFIPKEYTREVPGQTRKAPSCPHCAHCQILNPDTTVDNED
ncbi:uncharacterized protein LOC129596300 isoform X2 [Paramacrobiotus metropolitanus]|nr:uncharacterized protein LOC129596300 isoform X2 [Paramacrobiotus metropolitanus]